MTRDDFIALWTKMFAASGLPQITLEPHGDDGCAIHDQGKLVIAFPRMFLCMPWNPSQKAVEAYLFGYLEGRRDLASLRRPPSV